MATLTEARSVMKQAAEYYEIPFDQVINTKFRKASVQRARRLAMLELYVRTENWQTVTDLMGVDRTTVDYWRKRIVVEDLLALETVFNRTL